MTWTHFVYQLPGQQLLVVVATIQKRNLYIISLQGTTATIQAMTPKFNNLLLSFKIAL